jgi:Outer membrane protein beta-barrel domain
MRIAGTLAASLLGILRAQSLDVGIEAGLRATDAVSISSGIFTPGQPGSDESKRYIVGPTVELRLPWRLGIEFDALYRRFGYTFGYTLDFIYPESTTVTVRGRANSWEFPVVAQYRLRKGRPGLHVGAGYAPQIVHGAETDSGYSINGLNSITSFQHQETTNYGVTHGLVVSGGLDFEAGRLRISPELRYVRWQSPSLDQYGSDGSYHLQSSQNDFFFLVGIRWHLAR